jgi:hypothetical protein
MRVRLVRLLPEELSQQPFEGTGEYQSRVAFRKRVWLAAITCEAMVELGPSTVDLLPPTKDDAEALQAWLWLWYDWPRPLRQVLAEPQP